MPIITRPVELVDRTTPLSWAPEHNNALFSFVDSWLTGHPIRPDDSPMVVVLREIFLRIYATLLKLAPGEAPAIIYEAVVRQIEDDTRITGKLYVECMGALESTWCLVALVLKTEFTKHTPDSK